MTYLVTKRANDGTRETVAMEAPDRKALFAELEKSGVKAIRIEESTLSSRKLRKVSRNKSTGKKHFKGLLFAALAALVAVAAIVAWIMLVPHDVLDEKNQGESKKAGQIAEVEPAPAPAPAVEVPVKEPEPEKPEPPPFVKRPGALQLPNGQVITFRPPPPGQEKTVWVHGRKYIADSEGNFYDASPVPTFDNRFENTMEAMSAVGGGVLPAAALSIPKDDIIKYLASPITINDDDPEDVVEKKIATAEMKELLKDYIKDGGNWEDFVMELSNIKRNERMLQGQAIAEIAKMLREGDEEGAQEYRAKVDEFMKSKGYRGLKVPEKWGLGELPVATETEE